MAHRKAQRKRGSRTTDGNNNTQKVIMRKLSLVNNLLFCLRRRLSCNTIAIIVASTQFALRHALSCRVEPRAAVVIVVMRHLLLESRLAVKLSCLRSARAREQMINNNQPKERFGGCHRHTHAHTKGSHTVRAP